MAKTRRAAPAPGAATREKPGVYAFVNSNLPPEQLRIAAVSLLKCKELPQMLSGLPPEDRVRFLDRVDQVRGCFSPSASSFITPTQVLPTVHPENAKLVASLGTTCSAIRRLPTSAVISAGLETRGISPITPIGRTQIWRGVYGHRPVSIKVLPRYPTRSLEEVEEVRTISA